MCRTIWPAVNVYVYDDKNWHQTLNLLMKHLNIPYRRRILYRQIRHHRSYQSTRELRWEFLYQWLTGAVVGQQPLVELEHQNE